MYVYDYAVESVPRCHYKWAGIKRVEPVSRIRFNRVSSYKEPAENVLHDSTDKPKLKEKKPSPFPKETSTPSTIIIYTQAGTGIEESFLPTLDVVC